MSLTYAAVVARLRAAGCVFAEDEARLLIDAAATPSGLDELVECRVSGLPLEHVLGWAEFCGLRIAVGPGVFVPRRRTEFLARQSIRLLRGPRPVVVDLCCGSGAIGAAISAAAGEVELHAVDVDPAAVRCARRNVRGEVYEGNLYEPLPAGLRGRVDVLVANAPYVPSAAVGLMPPEARIHEPRTALDGGGDGLDILRRIASGAPGWLAPGGHLLVEASEGQAPVACEWFAAHGLRPRIEASAELDATIVIGTQLDPGNGRGSLT